MECLERYAVQLIGWFGEGKVNKRGHRVVMEGSGSCRMSNCVAPCCAVPAVLCLQVRVNGHQMAAAGLRKVSGYVQQETILPGTSTVNEYLTFHARLRMPAGSSRAAVRSRVAQVWLQA